MMRALIVDDELHAREELEALLQETGEFAVVGQCANAIEALREIRQQKPDVLFLDVQMPAIDGFELLSMIDEEVVPNTVFVTAFDEYAVQAFEQDALDYLVKPVETERLAKTIRKLKKNLSQGLRPLYQTPEIRSIPCVLTNRIKLVPTGEVEFVRSELAGVYVVSPKGEFFTELTLAVLERKTNLVRCHKQFLVNIEQIDEILLEESTSPRIRTTSGKTVPVSRRYFRKLKEMLGF